MAKEKLYNPKQNANLNKSDFVGLFQTLVDGFSFSDYSLISGTGTEYADFKTDVAGNTGDADNAAGKVFPDTPKVKQGKKGSKGVKIDTASVFAGLEGYDAIPYFGSDGATLQGTTTTDTLFGGNIATFGIVGASTHFYNGIDGFDGTEAGLPTTFDPVLTAKAGTPVTFDETTGFTVKTKLKVAETDGLGLSWNLITNGGNGVALRFLNDVDAGVLNAEGGGTLLAGTATGEIVDAIVLLADGDLDTADEFVTFAADEFDIAKNHTYELLVGGTFLGNNFILTADGEEVLTGDLLDYTAFEPDGQAVAFPDDDAYNPYATANYMFIGDSSDTDSAKFVLGATIYDDESNFIEGDTTDQTLKGNKKKDKTEFVQGGAGNETIKTFGGSDYIDGGAGNDIIDGGKGADTIDGGEGDDTISFAKKKAGIDTGAFGGSGGETEGDTLEVSGFQYVSYLNQNADVPYDLIGGKLTSNADKITHTVTLLDGTTNGAKITDAIGQVLEIETAVVEGTDKDDYLDFHYSGGGELAAVEISGGKGDDLLFGGNGDDTLDGGKGIDVLVAAGTGEGTGQIDTLTGGGGADLFVLGQNGTDFYDDADTSAAIIKDFKDGKDFLGLGNAFATYAVAFEASVTLGGSDFSGTTIRSGGTLIALLEGVTDATLITADDVIQVTADVVPTT